MGLLDSVIGAISGNTGGTNPMMQIVMGLMGNQGGLQGLVEQLTRAGLGQHVQSWVSTGQNMPISGEQLQNALGSEQIGQMASRMGISADALSGQLANLLPQVIDKATPDGSIPDHASLQESLGGILGGLIGGR